MSEAFFRTRAHAPRGAARRSGFHLRPFAVAILSTVWGTAPAEALALTEVEAIRGALSRPAWVEAEHGRVAHAQAAVTEASLPPNPVLSFERDRRDAATERTIGISQTLDVSGRRTLRREAADKRLDAVQLDVRDRRLAAIAEVRRAFGETLHREHAEAALARWLVRLEAAAATAAQLAKAGEVSGYDRRRFEREAQAARARLAAARADAARSREGLAALSGRPAEDTAQLAGELLLAALPTLETARAGLRARPDLASLVAQSDAFESEHRAAARAWIPDLTLGIGQKRVSEAGRNDNGMIVGLSVAVPLFDRGQAAQLKSRAQAQTLRAEHALALARAEGDLRGVWQQAAALREAAEVFRRDSLAASRDLTRIAEAAYRAGEAGLLELLDAYRAEMDAETTELDLALRARLARIELDNLSGVSFDE